MGERECECRRGLNGRGVSAAQMLLCALAGRCVLTPAPASERLSRLLWNATEYTASPATKGTNLR